MFSIPFKKSCIALVTAAVFLSACGSSAAGPNGTVAPNEQKLSIRISGSGVEVPDDLQGLGTRLVFSTAEALPKASQAVELINATDKAVTVLSVISDSPVFTVDKTVKNVKLKVGQKEVVQVKFVPNAVGVVQGKLSVALSGAPSFSVSMGGVNATGVESANEPNLQAVFDALGYKADVAMPAAPPTDTGATKGDVANAISTSSSAVGSEVLVHAFKQADATKPVQLIPLANYIGRMPGVLGSFGFNQTGHATYVQAMVGFNGGTDHFGGDNQQLLPGIGNGTYSALAKGSKISFTPKWDTFGFVDIQHQVFSEDALNYQQRHQVRIYPAVKADGTPIPNAYLLGEDSISNHMENYDYQDVVFLVRNVSVVN